MYFPSALVQLNILSHIMIYKILQALIKCNILISNCYVMLSDDVYDHIKGKGTAKTETQLNILLQILVSESLEKLQNYRSPRSTSQWQQIQVYKDMLQHEAVTSFELEEEVNRMTFSRNKQYLLENYLLESHQLTRERGKRPWTYYNTTPLGKVLAMRFWYQKREPQEIKMKVGRGVKIVDFEQNRRCRPDAGFCRG